MSVTLNIELDLGAGIKVSGPFCPNRIDRTPPIFTACKMMGWENSSLACYFDVSPQTIIRWSKGERGTPKYVVYLLTEGLRPKFENTPPPSEAERAVWDCAKAFWELSVAHCANFETGVHAQALDYAAEQQVALVLEIVEPLAQKIEKLEAVKAGEPNPRFQKFVDSAIDELRGELKAELSGARPKLTTISESGGRASRELCVDGQEQI